MREMSGTHTDPSVPVNMFGDQFVATAGVKPPAGKFVPLLHTAQAKFCSMKVNAVVVAAILRILRVERLGEFRCTVATALVGIPVNSKVIVAPRFSCLGPGDPRTIGRAYQVDAAALALSRW